MDLKINKLLELVDAELEHHTPGSDEWEKLLRNREDLIRQTEKLMEQERRDSEHSAAIKLSKRPDPNTIMQCVTGLVQVVGLAVVGWATRIDREAIRFIRKP